jgi:hypothetical protein
MNSNHINGSATYESRRTQANDVTMTTESRDLTAEKMRISVAAS